MYTRWEETVENERVLCDEAQAKTNDQMIRSYGLRHRASVYNVGEFVLIRNSKATTKRGKRVLHQIPSFEGYVLKRQGNRYRIQYATSDGENHVNWFPVSDVISRTKAAENSKQLGVAVDQAVDNEVNEERQNDEDVETGEDDARNVNYEVNKERQKDEDVKTGEDDARNVEDEVIGERQNRGNVTVEMRDNVIGDIRHDAEKAELKRIAAIDVEEEMKLLNDRLRSVQLRSVETLGMLGFIFPHSSLISFVSIDVL